MRWTLVLVALVACGKSDPVKDEPPPPTRASDEAKPPPPKTMAPAGDQGTCTLAVTGAATLDETSPAGGQSKYWMSDAELGGVQQSGFVLTCRGKQIRLSLVSSPNAAVEFKPKDYTVVGKNPDVSLLGRAGDKALSDFAGKISVTAFDSSHLAGSIDVTAKQTSGGAVTIKGTFDVKCAGFGKCAR